MLNQSLNIFRIVESIEKIICALSVVISSLEKEKILKETKDLHTYKQTIYLDKQEALKEKHEKELEEYLDLVEYFHTNENENREKRSFVNVLARNMFNKIMEMTDKINKERAEMGGSVQLMN